MKPQTVGRVLGIGLRVAGRMAGQHLAGSAGSARSTSPTSGTVAGASSDATQRNAGRQAGQATANVARGLGGFVRPFRRVGGILVLEVTGVFFLLFVLVFGQMAWRMRSSYAQGPDHQKFLVAAGLFLLFLYLSVSSFWRARRK
jgi:hypothetical protein